VETKDGKKPLNEEEKGRKKKEIRKIIRWSDRPFLIEIY